MQDRELKLLEAPLPTHPMFGSYSEDWKLLCRVRKAICSLTHKWTACYKYYKIGKSDRQIMFTHATLVSLFLIGFEVHLKGGNTCLVLINRIKVPRLRRPQALEEDLPWLLYFTDLLSNKMFIPTASHASGLRSFFLQWIITANPHSWSQC